MRGPPGDGDDKPKRREGKSREVLPPGVDFLESFANLPVPAARARSSRPKDRRAIYL